LSCIRLPPSGAVGAIAKPGGDADIARVVDFAARRRRGELHLSPPEPLRLIG